MERIDIIDAVGREYHTANIENGEFSYPKAFKEKNLDFEPIHKKKGGGSWQFLDIRFELDGVSLLIETKNDADKWPTVEEQIAAYVEYEKRLTGNKIIAMVANTTDDRITVWKSEVEDDRKLDTEEAIRTMSEYVSMFDAKHTNNKEEVMRNTYQLNELLHRHGVGEKLRSQFVGTCLLAIKNGLVYDRKMKTAQIIGGIRTILEDLLEGSLKKAEKLTLIDKRVLKNQDVRDMDSENLCAILDFIKDKIFPFINDKSTVGQDLLNLFFITFNKYVGKSDKNQAFTPDHITDFMAKICNVNKNSVVLDMVQEIGMRSEWTLSGKEAVLRTRVAVEQGDEFGAYIIDWMMPDLNGIETVRRIRKLIGESKPIIILTAYDWADIEQEAREAGVTAFCSKPLFMSELRDVLSQPYRVKKEETPASLYRFEGKKVLLVEDNLLNQEIAQAILQDAGFTVDTADDGDVAVERLQDSKQGEFDLGLMDIQMPKMDGYAATRQIRTLPSDAANVPIVAMTANAFEEEKQKAIRAGMNAHIAKPIEAGRLMETLSHILT